MKKLRYKGAKGDYPWTQILLTVELRLVYKIFLPQFSEHIQNKPTHFNKQIYKQLHPLKCYVKNYCPEILAPLFKVQT